MEKKILADFVENDKAKGERNVLNAIKLRKTNSIGCILRGNCLRKQVVEEKVEGTGRWGKRLQQLLDSFRKSKDPGNWNRKHKIALFGELDLEEFMDVT